MGDWILPVSIICQHIFFKFLYTIYCIPMFFLFFRKFYGIYGVDYSKKDKPRFEKNSFNFFLTLFKERRVDALAYE
jgi:hypothetical protein